MKQATMPLTDYQNACDAIREKTGTTDLIKSGEMAEKIMGISGGSEDGSYDEGFKDGKKAEYDAFWDAYQDNGNRRSYIDAFVRQGWDENTYNPKYDIIGETNGIQSLFSNSRIVDTKVNLIVRSGGIRAAFNFCIRLKKIPSLIFEIPITDTVNAFNQCTNLEEINISCVGDGCIAASFDIHWSTKLTHDSLMSIINALKDNGTLMPLNETYILNDNPYQLVELHKVTQGETFAIDLYSPDEYNGFVFEKAMQQAHSITIDGVEKTGCIYTTDYWVQPDDYTFNLALFGETIDGADYLSAYRYLKNKSTGEISGFQEGAQEDWTLTVYIKTANVTNTVTLGTTNLAKLTDAEKVQATEKGWTLL